MNKTYKGILILCMCIGLFGCGGNSDDDLAKETQSKIDKAGWKIELKRNAGTAVDDLTVTLSEYNKFGLSRNIETDTVDYVSFSDGPKEDDYTLVNYEDDKNDYILLHTYGGKGYETMSCGKFNLTTNEESTEEFMKAYKTCKTAEVDYANTVKELRDIDLKDAGIEITDLFVWARWYYENN